MTRPTIRVLATIVALALPIAVLGHGSANAATAITQTATCFDGAGTRWNAKVVWGDPYADAAGVGRISVYDAGWTTDAHLVRTDSLVRTYDGAGKLVQRLTRTNSFDYGLGRTYQLQNPHNPNAKAGPAKVKISLGVDGDGLGDCTVTFTQPAAEPLPGPDTEADRYEAQVATVTNTERRANGLSAVATQSCVDGYAESQARAMAADDRLYHQDLGPILRTCNLHMVGENIAYGYPSGESVTAAWMASPGHRANILNPGYRLLGVGAVQDADGRWYASQVFGTV